MEAVTELTALADEEGFLVVTPEGWEVPNIGSQVWNGGACCGPLSMMPDHVAATEAILSEVKALGACFDASRVFATGHSNGGIMTYRVACELSHLFAAVAVSSGYLADVNLDTEPPQQVFACEPGRPVPILHVHGLADECVPFEGGYSQSTEKTSPPIEEVIARWREFNDCSALEKESTQGEVHRRRWSCEAGAAV